MVAAMTYGNHALLLSCVASLLTLGASGDDINLYRLVLPAAFAQVPVGSLPLDDENTDFLASPAPESSRMQEADGLPTACGVKGVARDSLLRHPSKNTFRENRHTPFET